MCSRWDSITRPDWQIWEWKPKEVSDVAKRNVVPLLRDEARTNVC